MMTKSKNRELYTVIFLAGMKIGDDLSDCIKFVCTNKRTLSILTSIPYDRLVYLFTRLKKSIIIEEGNYIIKTTLFYKGDQVGGLKIKRDIGYNRNR